MSAVVVQLPARVQRQAKRRRHAVDVEERGNWMTDNAGRWETVEIDGRKPLNPRVQWLVREVYKMEGLKPPTTAKKHAQNEADCRRIQKRNAVKAWLASLGVDLDSIKDAEQALFAAFDKLA